MASEWKMFVAGPNGTAVQAVTPELDRAMDVLIAADMLHENKVRLLLAAEKKGRDPVAFAHHLVSIASAIS